jgi:hypothetical protein
MDKRTGKKTKVKKPATNQANVPGQNQPMVIIPKRPNSGDK